ncbi:MAG: MFS transporter [Acidobacteria bacterium]|nr:MAG: MFS transporter [Acidobacteriota bacterium]
MATNETRAGSEALDRARRKAYKRLIPLLFISYVIAYIDRVNVAFAKLTMSKDMPAFDNDVIGTGAGLFFLGYFLLEIPGTIIVEKWSARKWIARIMITWGIVASLNAWVKTPAQFYTVRFFLGLAEAGFFPGVVVFLTHWFPLRDRARAFALFLVATPIAQVISPMLCNPLLKIGMTEVIDGVRVTHPLVMGLKGWQWVFVAWGIPALLLGLLVLIFLTDWPRQAKWLTGEERRALEVELERERQTRDAAGHMTLFQALRHPRVLLLAFAYFCVVTANYGTEFFLPSILERWYNLKLDTLTALVVLPPVGALAGQLFVGWNSDRTKERRLHTAVPIALGALALALTPSGVKAYLPAFWTLPGMFLTSTAAAGSVGFINSVGNLGGFVGPKVMGKVETITGSYIGGIWFLAVMMGVSATIIITLFLGKGVRVPVAQSAAN